MYCGVKPQFVQTFAIKSDASSANAFRTFGAAQLVNGAGAFAVVQTHTDAYLVLTLDDAHYFENRKAHFLTSLQQFPGSPRIEWIRPLTRRLQRLLGWGDVKSTRADVARACEAKDLNELRAMMPQAARYIERAEFELLPALHDALRNPPSALEDCKHEFFPAFGGPCCHGAMDASKLLHMPPYTRCSMCKTVWCTKCARLHGERQEEQDDLKEALRECREAPVPPFAPESSWQQHPMRPLPFYVIDQQKVPNDEKLRWLHQELGQGATLEDFARKFLELFGGKVHTTSQQKALVLKLFGAYAQQSPACGWKKESDLPPPDLVEFQRVWDPDAPARCLECGKALPGERSSRSTHCSDACRLAGVRTVCAYCKRALQDSVHPYCTVCKRGSPPPQPPARKRNPGGPGTIGERLDKHLAEQRAMLAMAQRVWFTDQQKDPAHEPAWKSRRRS